MDNILKTEKISKLIVKMSLPMMFSLLIYALYNIVDSMFVARISQDSLAAVSLAYPLQNLVLAISLGTSIGAGAILSRRLGEKDSVNANKITNISFILTFFNSLLFLVIGLFLSRPFLSLFIDNVKILKQSVGYACLCLSFGFGTAFSVNFEKLIQATGNAVEPMLTVAVGAVINIILDPIFIFIFDMGVKGAAYATVIGQVLSAFLGLYYIKRNKYIKLDFKYMKLERKIVKDIYKVGLPTIIMNSVGTLMTSWLNAILINFSSLSVNIFNIYFKLQSFIFTPTFGLNTGLLPIISYNYGAKQKERINEALKLGMIISSIIMLLGTIIYHIIPNELIILFDSSNEMIKMGSTALRITSFGFVPAAFSIILISVFQATGYGVLSMLISILRQLVVLCPLAMILSHFIGLNGVWYSFVIAEIICLITSLLLLLYVYNKRIKNL